MRTVEQPALEAIEAARDRVANLIVRTPMLPLNVPGRADIYLKAESLQVTGSFKVRPASNAVLSLSAAERSRGICTVSSGNFAHGVAWVARRLGVPMATYMVHGALPGKIDAVRRHGGEVRFVSAERWWQFICGNDRPDVSETWIHPVLNPAVLAGNGTMGLEILEQLPDVDCILVPYGGGSLATGIAAAVHYEKPAVKVIAVESRHAAPLSAAFGAGRPVPIDVEPCYIQSIGGPSVLEGIWPLVERHIGGSIVVGVDEITAAVRAVFLGSKLVLEPAGAAAVAAAVAGAGSGKIVCIASGGNIDVDDFVSVLKGIIPAPH